MGLKDIIKKNRVSEVPFDEKFGVLFQLEFLHKSELQKITALYTKKTVNPHTRQMEDDLDFEKMKKVIFERCVKGWKGMTYRWLATKIPIDMSSVNPDDEYQFSQENLAELVEVMYGLDSWIFDAVKDAANFQDEMEKAEVKN